MGGDTVCGFPNIDFSSFGNCDATRIQSDYVGGYIGGFFMGYGGVCEGRLEAEGEVDYLSCVSWKGGGGKLDVDVDENMYVFGGR